MKILEVDLGLKIPATIYLAIVEFIILVFMVDVELGINIQYNIPLAIVDQDLMLMVEVDIGTRTAIITPITQVAVVYC